MIGALRKVGKILHRSNLTRNILIIKLRERVPLGAIIYDEDMRELGKLIEVFGPVKSPYGRVLLNDSVEEKVEKLKGAPCYVVEGDEEKVKWRKMPRPRKGRVE